MLLYRWKRPTLRMSRHNWPDRAAAFITQARPPTPRRRRTRGRRHTASSNRPRSVDVHDRQPPLRARAWDGLACLLSPAALESLTHVVPLDQVPPLAADIIDGKVRGRVVVAL